MTSIATTLGIGSGIDTAELVKNLAAAAKAPKEAQIAARETANKAKVSALASATSGIDTFASALTSLIDGGTLFTQPTSTDTAAVGVSALPGYKLAGLSARIDVLALAQGQSIVSATGVDPAQSFGAGSFTITSAAGAATIVSVPDGHATLAGVARAINAAGAGITASIVTSGGTARLVMKGQTGAAGAFTVQASGAFASLAYDPAATGTPTMQATMTAQDARVKLDGVETTRTGNSFSDLIPGVKFDLKKVTATDGVTIGASSPGSAIRQAVLDFASAYNELKGTLDTATASGIGGGTAGPLRGNVGLREMQRQMGRLTSTALASGSPATLAEIGVSTNRDGTLNVDTTVLDRMLASSPAEVEAMFNPSQSSSDPGVQITSAMGKAKPGTYQITNIVAGPPPGAMIDGKAAVSIGGILYGSGVTTASGLAFVVTGAVGSATITVDAGLGGALAGIRSQLRGTNGALTTTAASLAAEATALGKERTKMDERDTAYTTQLKASYAAMDKRVTASKATQAYLTQQIEIWTNADS